MITATWDEKISFLDMKDDKIVNSFQALRGFINDFIVHKN